MVVELHGEVVVNVCSHFEVGPPLVPLGVSGGKPTCVDSCRKQRKYTMASSHGLVVKAEDS